MARIGGGQRQRQRTDIRRVALANGKARVARRGLIEHRAGDNDSAVVAEQVDITGIQCFCSVAGAERVVRCRRVSNDGRRKEADVFRQLDEVGIAGAQRDGDRRVGGQARAQGQCRTRRSNRIHQHRNRTDDRGVAGGVDDSYISIVIGAAREGRRDNIPSAQCGNGFRGGARETIQTVELRQHRRGVGNGQLHVIAGRVGLRQHISLAVFRTHEDLRRRLIQCDDGACGSTFVQRRVPNFDVDRMSCFAAHQGKALQLAERHPRCGRESGILADLNFGGAVGDGLHGDAGELAVRSAHDADGRRVRRRAIQCHECVREMDSLPALSRS